MKVLILGGDGFIGSYLRKRHLQNGDKVVILDKSRIRSPESEEYKFYQQYVEHNNYSAFGSIIIIETPDFVYNCIAVATPHYYVLEPTATFDLDFSVNYEIIKILNESKIPFMHFSTSEVYGKTWSEPYNEDTSNMVLGPVNKIRWIYATSKILLDQLLFAHKSDCCVVRPFNFINHDIDWLPHLDKTDKFWKPRLPSCFLSALLNNEPIKIVNPGTQRRCYTYIDDAIDAIFSILDNWGTCSGEIINVGTTNETTVINAANLMIKYYKDATNIEPKDPIFVESTDFYGEGYEDSERRYPDLSKIKLLTGWSSKYNLDETFYSTVTNAINSFYFTK